MSQQVHIDALIAEGVYGNVYKATDQTGRPVAIKKYKPVEDSQVDGEDELPDFVLRELTILKQCSHPRVLTLLDWDKQNLSWFTSNLYDCNLAEWLHLGMTPYLAERKQVAYDILNGLAYLHSLAIYHRDLKTPNILISKANNFRATIADIGSSRRFHPNMGNKTPIVISLWWRPPELLAATEQQYDSSVDIWSLGVLLGEIFTGSVIFDASSELSMLYKIYQYLGVPEYDTLDIKEKDVKRKSFSKFFNKSVWALDALCENLVTDCLNLQPKDRPTANDLLQKYDEFNQYMETTESNFDMQTPARKAINFPLDGLQERETQLKKLYNICLQCQENTGWGYPILVNKLSLYFQTVAIWDHYMSITYPNIQDDISMVLIACYSLAHKLEDIDNFGPGSYINIFTSARGSIQQQKELIQLEKKIVSILDLELSYPLVTDYLDEYDQQYGDKVAIEDILDKIYMIILNAVWFNWSPKSIVNTLYNWKLGRSDSIDPCYCDIAYLL